MRYQNSNRGAYVGTLIVVYLAFGAIASGNFLLHLVLVLSTFLPLLAIFKLVDRSNEFYHQKKLLKQMLERKIPLKPKAIWNPTLAKYDFVQIPDLGTDPPIYLYLRTFRVDGLVLKNNIDEALNPRMKRWIPFYGLTLKRTFSLDEALASTSSRLLSLNADEKHIGALGIKVSDETWRDQFQALVDQSSFIFIVPGDSSGTIWEIKQLLAGGYLPKCLFILLPSMLLAEVGKTELSHERVLSALQVAGLTLTSAASSVSEISSGDGLRFSVDGRLIKRFPQVMEGGPLAIDLDMARLSAACE